VEAARSANARLAYYLVWDTDARDMFSRNGCPPTDSGSESFGSLPPTNAETPLANQVLMSVSTNGGLSWSAPRTVAYHPGHRLLWPWITAGSAGNVGVVWYQYNRVTDPDCGTGNVSVMAARISNATSAQPSETVVDAAGRPIHSGSGEDRRLGDYFTVNTDHHGCMIIATGDTTLVDPVTGQPSR
jgi:hypothetical protein